MRVEVRALDFTELIDGLRERRADVAFLYLPLDEPDLEITPLLSEPRIVVLPAGHRLAKRKHLSPADLDGEMFVKQPPPVPDDWCDFWMLVDELGHRPPVSPHMGANLEEWLHLIGRGEGIDTAPAVISRYYSWPEVAFVPLVDAAPGGARPRPPPRRAQDRLIDDFVRARPRDRRHRRGHRDAVRRARVTPQRRNPYGLSLPRVIERSLDQAFPRLKVLLEAGCRRQALT